MQRAETFSGAACFHVFWLEPRCEELKPIPFEHFKAAPLQSRAPARPNLV